ncbi:hypothetical protein H2200_010717 [Cladophialophora chaetospira]|uniref:Peptidase A1 domain-containing protein n=1 Tax=Cladophialophora chaetospira TaxID=386627 RepID=A0AA38X0P7_9EURO|nr:hypothetical protein H2200_010717 [Cladophialophora chaetospira]
MATVVGALVLLFSVVTAQNSCGIVPIYVDFHDRAIDGGITEQYGLFTGIGFPVSQNLSTWPSLSNNETTVASLDYCSGSPFNDCLDHAHGYYSPDLSQNYSSSSSYQRLDDYGSIPATIVETALDTYNLFTHYFDPSPPNITRVPNYPVTVLSNYSSSFTPWFSPAGLLGLGPDSTLLDHLYNSQLISSRSFGLYMGTAYEQSNGAINGSLTLGGYDSGRLDSDIHNFTISPTSPISASSPFKISVQQMTLTDESSGQTTNLLNSSFDAHITTLQYHLNLPGNVLRQFSSATGAMPSDDDLNVLRLPDGFNSKLTITLDSGLEITYDPEWLKNVSNNSPISTSTISDNATTTPVSLFGTAFLSNVYFIANYDSTPPTFHLANALPHAPYVMTQSLCPNTVPVAAKTHKISSFAASGMTGAILGGVIGGIGLTFAAFWLFRKYMQRRMWREQARQNMKGKGVDNESTFSGKGKGSPSTLASETERGNSSEMATFAFDFNSQQHQSYANYLNNAAQEPRPQTKSSISRTYSQFVKQISRENIASSRENLALNAAPPSRTQTPLETQALPNPSFQPQVDANGVSPMSQHAPSLPPIPTTRALPTIQYARPLTRSDTFETPITPATGVPLLFPNETPRDPVIQTLKHGPFHPLTLTHSHTSFEDNVTGAYPLGANRGGGNDEDTSFRARQAKVTPGGLNLNVQTEFAPPPRSVTDRIARKAVAGPKKEGLLKKVFPPS